MESNPLGLQYNSMAFIFLSQIPTTTLMFHQIQNPLPTPHPTRKFNQKCKIDTRLI